MPGSTLWQDSVRSQERERERGEREWWKRDRGREKDSWLLTVCFQPPHLIPETLSGLPSSGMIVSPFPPSWKGRFDLITIQLPSHSEKAHYAAEEIDLAGCQQRISEGEEEEVWGERREEKNPTVVRGLFCVCARLHLSVGRRVCVRAHVCRWTLDHAVQHLLSFPLSCSWKCCC